MAAAGPRALRAPGQVLRWSAVCMAAIFSGLLPSAARAGGEVAPPAIQQVVVAASGEAVTVRVVTSAPVPPTCRTFTLREPPRLVAELPGLLWEHPLPRRTAVGRAGVEAVRVGAYQRDPPVARVVFDLTVEPERLRYRMLSSPDSGQVVFEFQPPPGATAPSRRPAAASVELPRPPRQPPAEAATPEPTPAEAPPTGEAQHPPEPAPAEPVEPAAARGNRLPRPAAAEAAPAPAPGAQPPARPPRTDQVRLLVYGLLGLLVAAAAIAAVWWAERASRRAEDATRRGWLAEALRSADPMQRVGALRSLRSRPPEETAHVRDLLVAAAQDQSHLVADEARRLLAHAFPTEALLRQLVEGAPAARAEAARLLALRPTEEAAAALFEAAQSDHQGLRAAAMEALAVMARREPVRPVLRALTADEGARAAAAEVLAKAGVEAGGALRAALTDPDQAVRCGAIEALARLRPSDAASALAQALSDPSERVRASAVRALGLLGATGAPAEQLVQALGDHSPMVREQAALALARPGGPHLDQLITTLDRSASEDLQVRFSDEVLKAVAAAVEHPSPALVQALSSINRSFASGLAAALEASGILDAWVRRLGEADAAERDRLVAGLGAAAGAGAAAVLVRGLDVGDNRVREVCVRLLGEVGEVGAIAPIAGLLRLPDEALRASSAEALARLGGPEAVSALIGVLEDPSPRVRAAAAEGIGRAFEPGGEEGPPAEARTAGAALLEVLHDPAAEVRAAAAGALGRLRVEESIHALVDLALSDPEDAVRKAAMDSLEQMRAYNVLPLLLEVVSDPKPEIRARAMEIFARGGDPMATEVFIKALQDSSDEVRAIAARGLWEVASQGHGETLLPYIKSPDPKVRAAVAGALGKIHAAEYAGALAAAAADPDPRVRAAIVNAFARMGPSASYYLGVVGARLDDSDGFVRARAAEAVSAMAPESEDAGRRVSRLLTDPDPQAREAAAQCLVGYAKRGVCGPLLEALSDPERRQPIVRALGEVDDETLHGILRAAETTSGEAARAAVEALSDIVAATWTVEDIRPELASLDPAVRLAALEALALIRSPEAISETVRLLADDPSPQVRVRAAQLLAGQDGPGVAGALARAAQSDPDHQVRAAASAACRRASGSAS